MEAVIPISIKRKAVSTLSAVRTGELSRQEAEQTLKADVRHSSKLRADLVAELTADYDEDAAEALTYFRLI